MATNETTPAKKATRLTARQQYQLADAVKQEGGRLRTDRPTIAEAAEEFSQSLGFPVGPRSVRTAMAVTGVTWDTSGWVRRQPNRIDLDVWPAYPHKPGPARLRVEPQRRLDDERLCGVTVPRHAAPAETAAWLRRLADLLDRHGAELQAVGINYDIDDQAEAENDAKVQAGWAAILAAPAV